MPLYYLECLVCHGPDRLILTPEEVKGDLPCRKEGCAGKMKRTPRAPTSKVVETFDNGLMARRVEQPKDIQDLMHERSHTDYRNKR